MNLDKYNWVEQFNQKREGRISEKINILYVIETPEDSSNKTPSFRHIFFFSNTMNTIASNIYNRTRYSSIENLYYLCFAVIKHHRQNFHLLKFLSSFDRGLLWCRTKNTMIILATIFVFIFFKWNILIIFWSSYHHSTEVFFDVEQRTKWLFFRPSSFSFSSNRTSKSSSEFLFKNN